MPDELIERLIRRCERAIYDAHTQHPWPGGLLDQRSEVPPQTLFGYPVATTDQAPENTVEFGPSYRLTPD